MKVGKRSPQQRHTIVDLLITRDGSGNEREFQHPHAGRPGTPRRYAALTALSLLSIPLFSAAYDQVEHDGKLYACQHRCSISHLPGGQVHIRDTNGGWAALIVVNGGIIVDEEPKQP